MGKKAGKCRGLMLARLLALLLACMLTSSAWAQGRVLRLDPSRPEYDLAPFLEVLAETGDELTLSAVVSPAWNDRFKPLENKELILAGGRAVWLRLVVAAPAGSGDLVRWLQVANSNVGRLDFHGPSPGRVCRTGVMRPQASREVEHRCFIFRLRIQRGETRTYYLRLSSPGSMAVPLILWQPEAFGHYAQRNSLAFGMVYGVLLSMFLFNFFVFLSLHDPTYLKYVLYIICMLLYLFMINGHYVMVFDFGPGGGLVLRWIFLGGLVIFACAFGRAFLETRATLPWVDKLIILAQFMGGAVIVLGVLGLNSLAYPMAHLTGLVGPGAALAAGLGRVVQGYRPARFFLLAWLTFLLGIIHFVLRENGVSTWGFSGTMGMSLGSAVESVLLSFALADRIRLLRQEKDALARSRMRYRAASLTDGLTGLRNLRYMQDRLAREAEDAGNLGHPLSVVMMDVDDFKSFNDAYGHQLGDQVLTRLAVILRSNARAGDAACRYGGEEFVLILPDTDLEQACEVAQRIRREFAGQEYAADGGERISATISGGAAQLLAAEEPVELLNRADQALYLAKNNGKNRVEANRECR